jgi:hypothetical protein
MKSQGQVSLLLAAAMIFAFLVLSSDQYLLLLLGLGALAAGMVVRAIATGGLALSNLRKPLRKRADVDALDAPDPWEQADHTFRRVYPP